MIHVKLQGGLGNQMFQYAVGRHLSLKHQVPLILEAYAYHLDDLRDYGLGGFQIDADVQFAKTSGQLRSIYSKVNRKLAPFPLWPRSLLTEILDIKFTYTAEILNSPKLCYLAGYWQCGRYFLEISDQIRKDFQLAHPLSAGAQTVMARIEKSNTISLHVRRGDYVESPNFLGTCSAEWYETTMAMMAAEVDTPKFFVFSDDLEWARANLPTTWPIEFVFLDGDNRDCEDIHLMSLCRHHIIANSTFSWWGAWLNPDPNKRVIAPKNWFATPRVDSSDLLPPNWVKVLR